MCHGCRREWHVVDGQSMILIGIRINKTSLNSIGGLRGPDSVLSLGASRHPEGQDPWCPSLDPEGWPHSAASCTSLSDVLSSHSTKPPFLATPALVILPVCVRVSTLICERQGCVCRISTHHHSLELSMASDRYSTDSHTAMLSGSLCSQA